MTRKASATMVVPPAEHENRSVAVALSAVAETMPE